MVAMASPENHAARPDKEAEVDATLAEIVAEFGIKSVLTYLCRNHPEEAITSPRVALRVSQYILREIVHAKDANKALLEAEVMAIGCGVLDTKGIVTRIAAKHKVTRQAVSKRVVAFCDQWGLPPSGAMKSRAARATFSERNQPRL